MAPRTAMSSEQLVRWPRNAELKCQQQYIVKIRSGLKRYEGRLRTKLLVSLGPSDFLRLEDQRYPEGAIMVPVVAVKEFSCLRDMLVGRIAEFLPGLACMRVRCCQCPTQHHGSSTCTSPFACEVLAGGTYIYIYIRGYRPAISRIKSVQVGVK